MVRRDRCRLMREYHRRVDRLWAEVDAMPSETLEQRHNRMLAWIDGLRRLGEWYRAERRCLGSGRGGAR